MIRIRQAVDDLRQVGVGILDDLKIRDRRSEEPVPLAYQRARARVRAGLTAHPQLIAPLRKGMKATRRMARKARFRAWSGVSQIRFGPTRWLNVYDSRRLLVKTNDFRAFLVDARGGSQPQLIEIWRTLARERRPTVCIDVGANYGEFTCVLTDLGIPVITVEANPDLVECLRQSFAGNDLVTVVHAAAADFDGETSFFVHPETSGWSSLAANGAALFSKSKASVSREVSVRARRLDTLVPEVLGCAPESFLLKVDVEGFEEQVMRGCSGLVEGASWWRAMLEYSQDLLGSGAGSCWASWARYPGFVISHGERRVVVASLGGPLATRLPAAPPASCNLLIGDDHAD